MLSSTLKRSAATLGVVVAGLLAAAGPASAQFWEGESLRSQAPINVEPRTPQITNGNADDQMSLTGWPDSPINDAHTLTGPEAPASTMWAWHEAARTGLAQQGTQVGSEGVKSPTDTASGFIAPIGSDKGSLKAAGTETGNPERSGPALASSRAGAFALELEGKRVKAPASPTSQVFTSVSNVAVVGGLVPGGAIVPA